MNTKYTIKNFRVFDEQGVTVDIKPITILTGCNSSGKSSIVKSLILLNGYLNDVKEEYQRTGKVDLNGHCLDFSKRENSILGNFLRVVNRDSNETHVTLAYDVHSQLLGEDVTVSMEFAKEKNDELRNGHLHRLEIYNSQGVCFYASGKWMGGKDKQNLQARFNLYEIKNQFFAFVFRQSLLCTAREMEYKYNVDGDISDSQYESTFNQLKAASDTWTSIWGQTFKDDVRQWVGEHNFKSWAKEEYGDHMDAIEECTQNDVLCYIPIFKELEGKSKDETIIFLKNKKYKNNPTDIKNQLIDKLITLFEESPELTLLDFYRVAEKERLENYELLNSKLYAPYLAPLHLGWYDFVIFSTPLSRGYIKNGEFVSHELTDEEKEADKKAIIDNFNFTTLFTLLTDLSNSRDQYQYTGSISPAEMGTVHYHVCKLFSRYVNTLLEEVVVTNAPDSIPYVSSSIIEQRRLYPLESSNEMSRQLKLYLEAKRKYTGAIRKDDNAFIPGNFINKWAQRLGLADHYEVEVDVDGLGATIRRYKGKEQVGLLAEQGYGVTQLFVILLRIETAIMQSALFDHGKVKGFHSSTIAVEEPEVHLHPKFQSLLADLFVEVHNGFNVDFIVETHSEYLIRKLQTLVGSKVIDKDNISILYISAKEDVADGEDLVRTIGFRDDGCLNNSFGPGFFDETDRLVESLLDIKCKADDK